MGWGGQEQLMAGRSQSGCSAKQRGLTQDRLGIPPGGGDGWGWAQELVLGAEQGHGDQSSRPKWGSDSR